MSVTRMALLVAGIALSGCASSPKESFYTLNPVAPPALASSPNTVAAYNVVVGPVHIPEIVDRPQFVIRRGANQVEVLEQHRWAQPLRAEIAQAVSTGLAARLPQARIELDKDTGGQNADYRISMDVKRFEAVPGETVLVQAIWSIRSAAVKTPTTRQSTVRVAVNGNGYDELTAAFARAVMQISSEVADAVSSLQASSAR